MPFMSYDLSAVVNFPRVVIFIFSMCPAHILLQTLRGLIILLLLLSLNLFLLFSLLVMPGYFRTVCVCVCVFEDFCVPSAVLSHKYARIIHHSRNWRIAWKCIRCRQSGRGHTDFLSVKSYVCAFFRLWFVRSFFNSLAVLLTLFPFVCNSDCFWSL